MLRRTRPGWLLLLAVLSAGLAGPTHAVQPVSFELDVQPLLTSTGCNAGACHGKQRGQNGFQLSLLGFDPEYDYHAVAVEARGRRLSHGAPGQSLLLQKATAEVPHGGGRRFTVGSAEYETLYRWIEQGALRRLPGEPTLQQVELVESQFSLLPGQQQSLKVMATYSDHTQRDVTAQTTYLSNDATVVSAAADGTMTAGKLPGETAVMARYMNRICVAEVVIPQDEMVPAEFYADLPRNNFIDDLVYAKLQKLGIRPSEPIDDATFLRRVSTDLIGRVPTAEEVADFVQSSDPNKREACVDRLLQHPAYVDHWSNMWADLLRPNPYRVGIKAVFNYDHWIRQQFRDDVPYDEFVRKLVTAKGSTWHNGAVTLYRDRRSPDEMATLISQLFLGVRLECAKCHHHVFEKWSQQDFYQFAAFFAKVKHKGTGLSPPISGSEELVYVGTSGTVKHPVSGEVMTPRPLFGELPESVEANADPREALAAWMTTKDNDYFAGVQVNRLWAALMGRGLVDPVDDLRSTNPPSNPALLDALVQHFQDINFDNKQLLKTIALSNVYSLSSLPNESNVGDRLNYSRHYRHRLRAEVLMDSIAQITETPHSLSGMPAGSRANQVWTHRVDSFFLDTFGRPNENQDPPCERLADSTVTQALHLMNSSDIDARIRSDSGRAARLAASDLSSAEVAQQLYLTIYSRMPTDAERQYVVEALDAAQDKRRAVIEDLMWAMLNTPEFSIQN
ncbi:DUF1549 and DUF1553 domain-containing protein [Roseimaritima ulvae]|uniref:Bacterial Ig-like domain (Group 2) n=1 Tax=Roseimaritima ulvae TaxID=980254 RepID=A0A5B9QVG7_9BACT|nr:DUF1549 and DUF1553 domain-containing protein [Roseimaritima ulvae]QEG43038.1 hypothetical protein UC8_50810 [Roseimaritima ulvae]